MNKQKATTFGQRLRKLRGKMTQTEFADLLGIKQAMVSRYEADKEMPYAGTLLAMARFSGKSVEWLITGQEELQQKTENSITRDDLIQSAGTDLINTNEPSAQEFVGMMTDCFKDKKRMEKVLHFYGFLKKQPD